MNMGRMPIEPNDPRSSRQRRDRQGSLARMTAKPNSYIRVPISQGTKSFYEANRKTFISSFSLTMPWGLAFVYLAETEYRFAVPFGEKKFSYSPKAFAGELHVLTVRLGTEDEIGAYKDVALNVYDQHENVACFPHACANVETRGESVFAARNVINGNGVNFSHGKWPFESWGINQRPDAELTVHFGRLVEIDKVALTIRADFPHDSYWERATLAFSDGSQAYGGFDQNPQEANDRFGAAQRGVGHVKRTDKSR